MYDLIIVGGGPGGVAAGVYAARKKMKSIILAGSFGGQSLVSLEIRNWIGVKSISGYDLARSLEEHLRDQEGLSIVEGEMAVSAEKTANGFTVKTDKGKTFEAKYLLIVSGSHRRKLGVPWEKEFDGRGVVYCSTCDAPLFRDKITAVVGGGNAGLEAVVDLLPYASKIYLIVRSDSCKGDPVTMEKVKTSPKVEIIYNALTQEIFGDKFVTGIKLKNQKTGDWKELKLDGVFVEVGSLPNSDFVKDLLALNPKGEIIVNGKTQETSCPGIWAAGDVSDALYKQNNISAGDAVKAVLNIYDRLMKQ